MKWFHLFSFLFISSFSFASYGNTLKPFEAIFKVKVYSFTIGTARQTLSCQQQACVLTNTAKPPGWARSFINESVQESTNILQTEHNFEWQSYLKHLTRHYSDRTEHKTTHLFRQDKQILLEDSKRSWPTQPHVFDSISLAYAIQFAVLNKQPLDQFYLQDDKDQQKLQLKKSFIADEIDLPIEDSVESERFEFHSGKINIQLWLVPKWQYFPAKITLNDKKEGRTVVLELDRLHRPAP